LGAAGDGVAPSEAGRIYLPGGLPGERWLARLAQPLAEGWRAEPVRCLAPQPRAVPICAHFGRCGGCRLQHLPPSAYAAFKRQRIMGALERRGLPTQPVGEPAMAPPASRRRLRLGLAVEAGTLRLGLRARGSHRLEPIEACPIACPELSALLAPLAAALGGVLAAPHPAETSLTLTATGVDLLLHAARPPTAVERLRLAAVADALDLARLSWTAGSTTPEPLSIRRQPVVAFGPATVDLPPGAFLQATAFGEGLLAAAVAEWSAGCRHAVDLFAGVGTLTFALDPGIRSAHACEADPAAATALRRAAGRAGLGRVTVETRDLDRRPLTVPEFARRDLVVLDPPRAGALAQARLLARAPVERVVYASCHPESFARDARLLVDGGYRLAELRPIDQFRYAAEVELIALFQRPSAGRRHKSP
jgi:23S rRNA (uracil1939-C5)-methyltransferase